MDKNWQVSVVSALMPASSTKVKDDVNACPIMNPPPGFSRLVMPRQRSEPGLVPQPRLMSDATASSTKLKDEVKDEGGLKTRKADITVYGMGSDGKVKAVGAVRKPSASTPVQIQRSASAPLMRVVCPETRAWCDMLRELNDNTAPARVSWESTSCRSYEDHKEESWGTAWKGDKHEEFPYSCHGAPWRR